MKFFAIGPNLYEGNLDNEKKYLKNFSDCPEAVFVVAFDGKKVVGIASGLPLAAESEVFIKPFIDEGVDYKAYYYLSELVLKKNYRGQGIGHRFLAEGEAHAKTYGKFSHLCLCTVQRDKDDSRKPKDYYELDSFWEKNGFVQQPHLICYSSWKEIGASEKSEKSLLYWIKKI